MAMKFKQSFVLSSHVLKKSSAEVPNTHSTEHPIYLFRKAGVMINDICTEYHYVCLTPDQAPHIFYVEITTSGSWAGI